MNRQYFKAIDVKTNDIFFIEYSTEILVKQRIEVGGWDCNIEVIDKDEYLTLREEISERNKFFNKMGIEVYRKYFE